MLGIPMDAPVIGTVGRLNQQRLLLTSCVAALVNRSCSNIYFVWIGDGDLDGAAQNLPGSWEWSRSARFMGIRSDVIPLLPVWIVSY
jgi:hypothetical protein